MALTCFLLGVTTGCLGEKAPSVLNAGSPSQSADGSLDSFTLSLSAPSLSATPGENLNHLEWTAVEGAIGYLIYWKLSADVTETDSEGFLHTLKSEMNHFGLSAQETYYYAVRAYGEGTKSPLSSEKSAQPVDTTAPRILTARTNLYHSLKKGEDESNAIGYENSLVFVFNESLDSESISLSGSILDGLVENVDYEINWSSTNFAKDTVSIGPSVTWPISLAQKELEITVADLAGLTSVKNFNFHVLDNHVFISSDEGEDDNPGTKYAPYKSIQDGIDLAALLFPGGATVKIQEGFYETGTSLHPFINLRRDIDIKGGYVTGNWDDNSGESTVTHAGLAGGTASNPSRVFYGLNLSNVQIENIKIELGDTWYSSGVHLKSSQGVILSDVSITAVPQAGEPRSRYYGLLIQKDSNVTFQGGSIDLSSPESMQIYGIYCDTHSNLTLSGTDGSPLTISVGAGNMTQGVHLNNCSGEITHAILTGGLAGSERTALHFQSDSPFPKLPLKILNSTLEADGDDSLSSPFLTSYGIKLIGSNHSPPIIAYNRIHAGSGVNSYGVFSHRSDAVFHNNLIHGGTGGANSQTIGVFLKDPSNPTFYNNTISTGNGSFEPAAVLVDNSSPHLFNNLLFAQEPVLSDHHLTNSSLIRTLTPNSIADLRTNNFSLLDDAPGEGTYYYLMMDTEEFDLSERIILADLNGKIANSSGNRNFVFHLTEANDYSDTNWKLDGSLAGANCAIMYAALPLPDGLQESTWPTAFEEGFSDDIIGTNRSDENWSFGAFQADPLDPDCSWYFMP
jgi:hypothetical protein